MIELDSLPIDDAFRAFREKFGRSPRDDSIEDVKEVAWLLLLQECERGCLHAVEEGKAEFDGVGEDGEVLFRPTINFNRPGGE